MGKKRKSSILVEADTPKNKNKRKKTSVEPSYECAPIDFGDMPGDDADLSWLEPLSMTPEEEKSDEVKKKDKARSKDKRPKPAVEVVAETVTIAKIDKKRKKDNSREKRSDIERTRKRHGGAAVEVSAMVSSENEQRKSDGYELESDVSVPMEAGDTRKRKKHKRSSVATEDDFSANEVRGSLQPHFDAAETDPAWKEKKKKKKTDNEHLLEPPVKPQMTTEEVLARAGDKNMKRKKDQVMSGENLKVEEREMESRKERRKQRRGGEERERWAADDRGAQRVDLEESDESGHSFYERSVLELKEFVPDIMSKSPQIIHKMLKYDLERFRNFKKQGLAIRKGRFSAEENEQIRENVNNFLVLTGIHSATRLIFPSHFPEESQEIRKLRSLHRFHHSIAEGVARPWHLVYVRARKMFDKYNNMGRFSEEELHSLAKHHTLHGNNWTAIAKKMDRSSGALEKRHCLTDCAHGPWKPDEVLRLKRAVRGFLETLVEPGPQGPHGPSIRRERLYSRLAWADIAHQVQTRHWIQCRLKWMDILKTKMAARGPRHFARGVRGFQDKIELINTLYALQVDDAADIDWEKVAASIGNVTPMHVQKNFYRLKVSRVPLATSHTYAEIMDFLYEKVVPELRRRLEAAVPSGASLPLGKGAQEVFFLKDILPEQEDDKEEEFSEVDNAHINRSDYGLAEEQEF